MKRQFALPIAIAVAVHAALLFGFRPASPPRPVEREKPSRTDDPIKPMPPTIEIVDPPDAKTPDDTAPPKGVSDVERPEIPEPPVSEKPAYPVMEVTRSKSEARVDLNKMDLTPYGTPTGSDSMIGPGPGLLRVADLDNAPRARLQEAPAYPFAAKRDGREGTVTVEFTVDESGRVIDPRVMRSSDPVFEEATLRAVAKWRFEPGRHANRIVRFHMAVPVVFHLDEN